jgi:hypothetical protein
MDIATASPLVILEVVISLFSGVGIIVFLEYNAVIFLKLPDVLFISAYGTMMFDVLVDVLFVKLVVEFSTYVLLNHSVVFITELFKVLTTI